VAGGAAAHRAAGAVSVDPRAIGAASGLDGCVQLACGVLRTIVLETWRPGAVFPVARLLLGSALLEQPVPAMAVRRA